jgi:Zn-dependent peptidase ImmA (M78 family)
VDAWIDIRRKARACNAKALAATNGDRRVEKMIEAALKADRLEVETYEFAPGTLGSLNRAFRLMRVQKNLELKDELVVIAHEIGHFHMHHDPHNEVTSRPDGPGGDPVDSGAGKVEGYSPNERKEVQADIFSGELLCPADWLREEFVGKSRHPENIAKELGLPSSLVMNQLVRAVLLPPIGTAPEVAPAVIHDLDESQMVAVMWEGGPLLVEAGPAPARPVRWSAAFSENWTRKKRPLPFSRSLFLARRPRRCASGSPG